MRHEATFRQRALGDMTAGIRRFRSPCLIVAGLIGVMAIVLTLLSVEIDTGVPNIFPESHNQNHGKDVFGRFYPTGEVMPPLFQAQPVERSICNQSNFGPNDAIDCSIFWCEVKATHKRPQDNSCHCFQQDLGNTVCGDATVIMSTTRFVGPSAIPKNELDTLVGQHFAMHQGHSFSTSSPSLYMTQKKLSPLLLEEWETGETALKPMFEVAATLQRASQTPLPSCGYKELCFCGTYVCKLDPEVWRQVPDIKLPSYASGVSATAAPSGGRLLATTEGTTKQQSRTSVLATGIAQFIASQQESELYIPYPMDGRLLEAKVFTVPSDRRANVKVIWGVQVFDVSPMLGEADQDSRWSFQESFDLSQPWAQRNIYGFCTDAPAPLKISNSACWIEHFKYWLNSREEKFPVLKYRFNELVMEYIKSGLTGLTSSRDYLWIRDNTVKACYASFTVDHHKNAQTAPTIELMEIWDKEISIWNDEASRFARGAWHMSGLWVRAQAQQELLSSTGMTLAVVLILSFLGMLAFTMDFVLSFFVVFATVEVLCCLAFFITTLMGWPIGPIEVIALIVFIGYAVTYSLHIAHRYGGHDALEEQIRLPGGMQLEGYALVRYRRTDFALKAIGGAAIGSAVTTTGCAVFLLFCTLTIFQKLGGVVLAVTVMSITIALGPLPAALMCIGPGDPGKCSCLPFAEWAGALQNCCCWLCHGHKEPPKPRRSRNNSIISVRSIPGETIMSIAGAGQALPGSNQAVHRVAHPVPGAVQGQIVAVAPAPHGNMPSGARMQGFGGPGSDKAEVDDVRLSEKGFDIGEESPLEPIWAREQDKTTQGRLKGNTRTANNAAEQVRPPRGNQKPPQKMAAQHSEGMI